MKKIRYAFLLIAALPFFLNAQSIHQENILYGAAYELLGQITDYIRNGGHVIIIEED